MGKKTKEVVTIEEKTEIATVEKTIKKKTKIKVETPKTEAPIITDKKAKKPVSKLKGYKGLKKLIPFYKKYLGLFFATILSLVASGVIGLFGPIFSAQALANLSELKFEPALWFALAFVGVRLLVEVANHIHGICYVKMDSRVVFDIKQTLIRSITSVTMGKSDQTNSGVYIERMNEDAGKCSDVLMDIMSVILDVISNFAFLIYIAFLNIWFFIALVIYVLVLWAFDSKKERMWFIQRKKFREKREIATGSYNEQVRGLRDVKSLNIRNNTIKDSGQKFDEALDIHKLSRFTRRKWVLIRNAVGAVFEVGFFVMGILFIQYEFITLAGFLVIYMYHGNVKGLTNYFAMIKQYSIEGELAAQRVFEIIDEYPKEKFGDKTLEKVEGKIEFKDVTFGYVEDENVLENLNLTFEPNKTTAVVGKSGSGKSTILALINKLYDVKSGELLLDGENINELTEDSIRNNIGIVNQAPYIFNRTIRENLLFINPEATEEQMISALKRAQIYNFIKKLDKGLDSLVGENGVMLSGGQKQRIAIARILLKNSKIIVFDEATSALDNESQGLIVKAIDSLKKDHTIIIVAHRLSTIVGADSIVVLDSGKILDQGTHNQLFRRCKMYKELYKSEETRQELEELLGENQ